MPEYTIDPWLSKKWAIKALIRLGIYALHDLSTADIFTMIIFQHLLVLGLEVANVASVLAYREPDMPDRFSISNKRDNFFDFL